MRKPPAACRTHHRTGHSAFEAPHSLGRHPSPAMCRTPYTVERCPGCRHRMCCKSIPYPSLRYFRRSGRRPSAGNSPSRRSSGTSDMQDKVGITPPSHSRSMRCCTHSDGSFQAPRSGVSTRCICEEYHIEVSKCLRVLLNVSVVPLTFGNTRIWVDRANISPATFKPTHAIPGRFAAETTSPTGLPMCV